MEQGEHQPAASVESNDAYGTTARTQEYQSEPVDSIRWSASEFIDHQKNAVWFVGLFAASLAIGAAVFWMTGDWFGPVIIALLGLAFGIGAARRPRVLEYALDDTGIHIAEKVYPYEVFRSYTVMQEGAIESIFLVPAKRWMPGISLYYEPSQAEMIEGTIGAYLPFEERASTYVDRFLHKIRF